MLADLFTSWHHLKANYAATKSETVDRSVGRGWTRGGHTVMVSGRDKYVIIGRDMYVYAVFVS